jgi:hypothetical protein
MLKLVEETTISYHLQISVANDGSAIINEIHRGTTVSVRDKKTGGLVTSRSNAEIMQTADAEKIAAKIGLPYVEPTINYRFSLNDRFRVQSGFQHKLRKSRQLAGNRLKRRAKWLGLKLAKVKTK